MIDHIQVKWIAEKTLREQLREVPAAANWIISDKSRWNTWIDLLTKRLRECEQINLIRSKESLHYAIGSWTCIYALRELDKSEWKKDDPEPA